MKGTIISIIIAAALISGAILISNNSNSNTPSVINDVDIVNGKQIIEIEAKGGYSPRVINAKADTPSVIKISTRNTFDCSIALVIPSLGYRKNLSPTGTAEIEVPSQKAGSKIQGLCAMGMYSFVVNFN